MLRTRKATRPQITEYKCAPMAVGMSIQARRFCTDVTAVASITFSSNPPRGGGLPPRISPSLRDHPYWDVSAAQNLSTVPRLEKGYT